MISKKNILSLAVLLATAALTACGDGKGSSGTEPEAYIAESLSRSTSIRTVLSGPKAHVALNNNLLFDPNTGRLNIPVPEDEDQSILNPKVAMNYADGFSTSMPIYIAVDGRGFGAGVPVIEGVSLFNVNTSSKLTYGVDFVASTLKDQIIIVPRKPFEPSSNYVLVLTNQIKDMQNEPIGMSGSYAGLKSHTYTQGKLAQAQQLMQKQEQVAQAGGIDPQTIVYSSMFTTGSVGNVMTETAKELLKLKTADTANFRANPDNLDLTDAYSLTLTGDSDGKNVQPFSVGLEAVEAFKKPAKEGNSDKSNEVNAVTTEETSIASDSKKDKKPHQGELFKAAFKHYYDRTDSTTDLERVNVTKGTVKLPYFLETGANFNTTPFEPANPEASAVTRYSPLPKIKSLQEVKFILFTPKQDVLNGLDGGNLKGLVIYQHGVTSIKEDAYSFAADLVNKGLAVIAIDHPIHGERMVNGAVKAHTDDATPYLNLAALPVARDNMRQSVLDILGLRLALEGQYLDILPDGVVLSSGDNVNTDSALKLESASIKFLGHSLGGILGNTAMAIANKTGASEYQFGSAVFAKSGGHIAELLFASETFGPLIKHNLNKSNLGYQDYVSGVCEKEKPTPLKEGECYNHFATANKEAAKLIEKTLVPYKIIAQTLIDTVDPHSVVSAGLYPNDLPTLLIQVENDDTVPNHGYKDDSKTTVKAVTAHFIGTEGLRSILEGPDVSANSRFAEYATGDHKSLLIPDIGKRCLNVVGDAESGFDLQCVRKQDANTGSMRKLVVDFLSNDGKELKNIDSDLVTLSALKTGNSPLTLSD
ncbi:lipase [Vibrio sp. Of14-4]|uniref:lipase n=1 Tax=Vibrio sp. Of14-4 TaxID=2724878 RepID=UPI001EF35E4D|nr:lipase [Vibrio sp. Of14-4]MCG7489487.1 lipase [Vibrio sp. Of14-4]